MDKQPMPPMLTALIKQLRDGSQSHQYRDNIANRLEDVAQELMREVRTFRGDRRAAPEQRRGRV
jgi:hypothetical protein